MIHAVRHRRRRRGRPAGCPRPDRPSPRGWRAWPSPRGGPPERRGRSAADGRRAAARGRSRRAPAPAISPARSARSSASVSTIGPRAVFTSTAVGFIAASSAAPIRPRVSLGERAVQRHHVGRREAGPRSGSSRPATTARAPNPCSRRATAWPMRPPPTRSTVAPCRSRPSRKAGSHVSQSPARTAASRLRQSPEARRASGPAARSAVASVSTPGCCPPGCRGRWPPRRPCCRRPRRSWRSPAGRGRRRSARRRRGR